MRGRSFFLKPFPSDMPPPHLNLTCRIEGPADRLSLSYAFLGPLEEIIIPAPADPPSRKNSLWEETCFEFFVGTRNSDKYWEFNLSPAGNWNVYLFTSYRQGMQEEPAFTSLPLSVNTGPDGLRLSVQLDLRNIIPAGQVLKIAVSAVIKQKSGKITHWALTHPGPKPDFHRRDCFIVEV
jgi:hypothetical protein